MGIGKTVNEIRFSKIHFVRIKPKLRGGVCRKMYRDLGLTPNFFYKYLICTTIKNMGYFVHLRWTRTHPQSQDYKLRLSLQRYIKVFFSSLTTDIMSLNTR